MRFVYVDKNGENEIDAEGVISVYKGYIAITAQTGDGDGSVYYVNIPRHRARIRELIDELEEALMTSEGTPIGYDGYSGNAWSADRETGTVKCY